jgi:hypothetical protein
MRGQNAIHDVVMHIRPTIHAMMVKSVSNPVINFRKFNFGQKVLTVNALQFDDEMPGNHVYSLLDSQHFLSVQMLPAVASFDPHAKKMDSTLAVAEFTVNKPLLMC